MMNAASGTEREPLLRYPRQHVALDQEVVRLVQLPLQVEQEMFGKTQDELKDLFQVFKTNF